MEPLASFDTYHEGNPFGISVSVQIVENQIRLLLQIRTFRQKQAKVTEIHIDVDSQSGILTLNNLAGLSGIELCLAGCAVKSLIGPLVECFNRSPRRYIDCLKKKGINITKDIIKCAIDCGLGSLGAAS